ncbi:hypothetical protein HYY73_02400 [Candidatus Woesearchaeota archaeon]|nr:hypothetical protein [Candidatus Woesearchaeota archaeon]
MSMFSFTTIAKLPLIKVGQGRQLPARLQKQAEQYAQRIAASPSYGKDRAKGQMLDCMAEAMLGCGAGGIAGLFLGSPLDGAAIGAAAGVGHEAIANVLIRGFYFVKGGGRVTQARDHRVAQVLDNVATLRDYEQHRLAAIVTLALFYTIVIGMSVELLLHQAGGFIIGAAYGLVHSVRIVRKGTKLMKRLQREAP